MSRGAHLRAIDSKISERLKDYKINLKHTDSTDLNDKPSDGKL